MKNNTGTKSPGQPIGNVPKHLRTVETLLRGVWEIVIPPSDVSDIVELVRMCPMPEKFLYVPALYMGFQASSPVGVGGFTVAFVPAHIPGIVKFAFEMRIQVGDIKRQANGFSALLSDGFEAGWLKQRPCGPVPMMTKETQLDILIHAARNQIDPDRLSVAVAWFALGNLVMMVRSATTTGSGEAAR